MGVHMNALPVAPCGHGTMATSALLVQLQWMFLARTGWQKSRPMPDLFLFLLLLLKLATAAGLVEGAMSDTTTSTSDNEESSETDKLNAN